MLLKHSAPKENYYIVFSIMINNIFKKCYKNYFINNNYNLSRIEKLLFTLLIIGITYFIAPVWSPGGESWGGWVAARIFNLSDGFPVNYFGPLYFIYLKFFLLFDYPLSVQAEHFVTHMFTYFAVFMLLNCFLPAAPSLIICCAWIPEMWIIEGSNRVAAMGFLSIYLSGDRFDKINKGFVPLSLLIGSLFDRICLPFLLGHFIGFVIWRVIKINRNEEVFTLQKIKYKLLLSIKLVIFILFIVSNLFQSQRLDNNAQAFQYPWTPIPQSSNIITFAFFGIGNGKWIFENVPYEIQPYTDWFYTHKIVYGGAQTLTEYVIKNPKDFLNSVIDKLDGLYLLPGFLFLGFYFKGLKYFSIIFWLLLPFLLININKFHNNKSTPNLFAIVFGTVTFLFVLLMIRTLHYPRYTIVILPVGIFIFSQMAGLLYRIFILIKSTILGSIIFSEFNRNSRRLLIITSIIGYSLIVIGIISNEWFLLNLFSDDGILESKSRIIIWVFNILNVLFGFLIIRNTEYLVQLLISRFNKFEIAIKYFLNNYSDSKQNNATLLINLSFSICIFYSSFSNYGNDSGILNLSYNPFLMQSEKSLMYKTIIKKFDKSDRILSLDEPLIRAFSNVEKDNVFHGLFLPPFYDESGKTEDFLNSLNVILVSDHWSREHSSYSTQEYLRYYLHVKPFVDKSIGYGWSQENIDGYGILYRKIKY